MTAYYSKLLAKMEDMQAQLAAMTAECEAQARLNGMGSEREARLMADVTRLEANFKKLSDDDDDTIDTLRAQLEAVTRERDEAVEALGLCEKYGRTLDTLRAENDRLMAALEEMIYAGR
jgi:uncharacterized protein involved in exopolysaccharide biosynthesis